MTGAQQINASLVELYWQGYQHGCQGLPMRDLYAHEQSTLYRTGYEEGLEVYEYARSRKAETTKPATLVVNQVMALRNQIDEWESKINKAKEQIRKLEASS